MDIEIKKEPITKEESDKLVNNRKLIEVSRKVGRAKIMYPYLTPEYIEDPTPQGRPLKYRNPLTLKKKINEFFQKCDETNTPYTMSGFALFLGVTRQALIRYQLTDKRFEQILEDAKTKIESYAESKLFDKSSSGAMFALKNNFANWKEEKETVVKGPLGSILDNINANNEKFIRD